MKKLIIYYLLVIAPFVTIILLGRFDFINSSQFVGLLFFYLFVYRTYLDGKKLSNKNLIPKKDIWKLSIPGKRMRYLRELYLE